MSATNKISVEEASAIFGRTRLAVRNAVARRRFEAELPARITTITAAFLICVHPITLEQLLEREKIWLEANGGVSLESLRAYLDARLLYEREETPIRSAR